MHYLILNSDDYGYSSRVNAAVIRSHRDGILTSASLMVGEVAYAEAVELARRTPTLGVGLHVTVSYDHAVLPPSEIRHLVDANGRFGADVFRASVLYARSGAARFELRREIEAQFERFARTGLRFSHVDGHQHMHMVPAVWDIVLELCDRYGIHRVRIPHEELRAHFRSGGDRFNINTVATLLLRLMRRRCLRTLRERQRQGKPAFFYCDRVYGQLQSGNMNRSYLLRLLPRLQGVANEIYFHPGAPHARPLVDVRPQTDIHDVELQALLAPDMHDVLDRMNICPGRYEDVEKAYSNSK